jgi:hypothetical protein
MPIVPGVLITNAIQDLFGGHMLMFTTKSLEALVVISTPGTIGMTAAMIIVAKSPLGTNACPITEIIPRTYVNVYYKIFRSFSHRLWYRRWCKFNINFSLGAAMIIVAKSPLGTNACPITEIIPITKEPMNSGIN